MSTLFCFPCSKERWLPPPGLPAPLKFLVPLALRNKLNSLTNPMAKALLIIFRSTCCSGNFDFTRLLHFLTAKACVLSLPKMDRVAVTDEVLVGGIYLIINFRGCFLSHFESMPAQANTFPCHRAEWSSLPPTRAAA